MKKKFLILLILILSAAAAIFCYMHFNDKSEPESYKTDTSCSPVISLKGESEIHLKLGEAYEEPGFTAKDYKGNDITDKVTYSLDGIKNGGTHHIYYTVSDLGLSYTVERTVYVEYEKPDETSETFGHGIPVLMYHYVYDADNPPSTINSNFISDENLEEELSYLVENDWYFPTWEELRKYVDGEIELPLKSIVLTFDDCSNGFIKNGIPLLEKYDVTATSFVICINNGEEMANKNYSHVNFQSHSYDMHKAGGNIGHGGIFTALSLEEGTADLEKSIEILGSGDAFAYPFGDYTDTCRQAVNDAGFLVAFTTQYGKVCPGDDPLLLPRVRISGDISLDEFISEIEY